jgi:hypothetical protein
MAYNLGLTDVLADIKSRFTIGRTPNAIVEYICDLHAYDKWDSVSGFIRQLEMASCASGSFGADTIYTHLMREKLASCDWLNAIEEAMESYADATGESPDIFRDNGEPSNLVSFAVDWWAQEIAGYLNGFSHAYVAVLDAGEVWEERHAFLYESEADDLVSEAFRSRMESEVQHATETLTDEQWQEMEEQLQASYHVQHERL